MIIEKTIETTEETIEMTRETIIELEIIETIIWEIIEITETNMEEIEETTEVETIAHKNIQ